MQPARCIFFFWFCIECNAQKQQMKKTYIVIIVVIVVLAALYFYGKSSSCPDGAILYEHPLKSGQKLCVKLNPRVDDANGWDQGTLLVKDGTPVYPGLTFIPALIECNRDPAIDVDFLSTKSGTNRSVGKGADDSFHVPQTEGMIEELSLKHQGLAGLSYQFGNLKGVTTGNR